MNKDKKSHKTQILIAIIVLLIIILTVVLISVFACKPKSKNTQQLEIVGQEELDGEINLAGQSETYVAKYDGNIINDCTWSLDTFAINNISLEKNSNIIKWDDSITNGRYPLVLSVKKDGYKSTQLDVILIITLPKLHIIGESEIQGSYGFANQSKTYVIKDSYENDIDHCSWSIEADVPGIGFSATYSTFEITWDNTVEADVYSLSISASKDGYHSANFDVELNIYDNYLMWDTSPIIRKVNIDMEIQNYHFFSQDLLSTDFRYYHENGGTITVTSIPRDEIIEIHFMFPKVIDNTNFTPVFDGFMRSFCYDMLNMYKCSIIMPEIIPENVNRDFMRSAFEGCTALARLNDDLVMPINYTQIGESFLYNTFSGCNALIGLPDGFGFPAELDITDITNFMRETFYECQNIQSISSSFSIPYLNVISDNAANYFCYQTFYNCSNITFDNLINGMTIDINYSPTLDRKIGTNFCREMFSACIQLTELPDNFNLPSQITKVGDNFCYGMFQYSHVRSLPNNFNLPPLIEEATDYFCANMFLNCDNLRSLSIVFTIPQNMTFKVGTGSHFAYQMFMKTHLIKLPDTFNLMQAHQNFVGDRFCDNMFAYSDFLETLPYDFAFPSINSSNIGDYFCYNMFFGCIQLSVYHNNEQGLQIPAMTNSANEFCINMFTNTHVSIGGTSISPGEVILVDRNS